MSKNSIQRNRLVHQHRLRRKRQENLLAPYESEASVTPNASVECGWGRLVFAHTFESPEMLAEILRAEGPEQRDIAFYVRDPHVALAAAPQELFLDPSHTYRLDLATYRLSKRRSRSFSVRRLTTRNDADAVNVMYASRGMVTVLPEFFWSQRDGRILTMLVAEDAETSQIIGTVMGIDHARAFNDPEAGSSLWCLAVAPQAPHAGVGEALVRCLAEHFKTKGANYMDLSVLHDNVQAITLYEKLGFKRVPMFAIKRKNVINETLYTVAFEEKALNPYAMIIIDEARKRGIATEIVDAEGGFFRLTYGGRSIA
ncbi:MAG: GNAT family N-acetyltransferase [Pseudomonadota bacterium]